MEFKLKNTVLSYLFVVVCCSSIFYSTGAHAESGWVSTVRPYVERFLGDEIATKLFGEKAPTQMTLPAIPKVQSDTTSTRSLPEEGAKIKLSAKELASFNQLYIQELYEATRQRPANTNDIAKWMNVLSQGGTREGVYRNLVLDQSYAGLEGGPFPMRPRASEFASSFMQKYIGKEVSKKAMSSASLYTVKRIITDDALDIVDEFLYEGRMDDLYTWYAVMSSEFATEYPNAFKAKSRQETDASWHKSWAEKVGWQVLKSEVIIKIHSLLNLLNQP